MKNKKLWTGIVALVLIAIIALIDIGANIIGMIPGAGDLAETASEILLEILQGLITTAALILIGTMRGD